MVIFNLSKFLKSSYTLFLIITIPFQESAFFTRPCFPSAFSLKKREKFQVPDRSKKPTSIETLIIDIYQSFFDNHGNDLFTIPLFLNPNVVFSHAPSQSFVG